MKYATVGATGRPADPSAPTYVPPNPIDPAAPLPSATPLPPGTAVVVGTENVGAWSVDKFAELVGTGADLAMKSGVNLGPLEGFDFGAAFTKIAAAAAVGAAFGPVGIGIAVLVAVVSSLGGVWARLQNPNWYAVGPGVHEWATAYAPEAFVSEAQAKGLNTWQSVPEIARHLLAWWLARGVVLTGQNGRYYSGILDSFYISAAGEAAFVTEFYASAGVDWNATREARFAANDFAADRNVMMYKIAVQPRGAAPVDLGSGRPVPGGTGSQFDTGGGGGALVLGGLILLGVGLASRGGR